MIEHYPPHADLIARHHHSGDVPMNIRLPSATLIALAAGAFAADPVQQVPVVPIVKDSDLKLTVGGQFQMRADWSQARTGDDRPYDVTTATVDRKSDDLDFYMRRLRLFTAGSWQDFTFKLGLRADLADRRASGDAYAFAVHNACVNRTWKMESVTHGIQLGLDYPFFNSGAYCSTGALLLPSGRATEMLMGPRGTGVGYRLPECPLDLLRLRCPEQLQGHGWQRRRCGHGQ